MSLWKIDTFVASVPSRSRTRARGPPSPRTPCRWTRVERSPDALNRRLNAKLGYTLFELMNKCHSDTAAGKRICNIVLPSFIYTSWKHDTSKIWIDVHYTQKMTHFVIVVPYQRHSNKLIKSVTYFLKWLLCSAQHLVHGHGQSIFCHIHDRRTQGTTPEILQLLPRLHWSRTSLFPCTVIQWSFGILQ